MNIWYQIDTDLLAVEVTDDDMIWVMQKEQQIKMVMLVWDLRSNTTNWAYQTIKDRLTGWRSSRWWYDLSYAKEVTNQYDVVSMIWGLIQQIEHIISNRDRLTSWRSGRWWYDLSYAKEAMNRNDIVNMSED